MSRKRKKVIELLLPHSFCGTLIKGRFPKRVVFGECPPPPRSGFRSRGTYECTLVPVFVPGEHPPKRPFWETTLLSTPERIWAETPLSQTHPPKGTPDPANSLCLGSLSKYRKKVYIKNFERGSLGGPKILYAEFLRVLLLHLICVKTGKTELSTTTAAPRFLPIPRRPW